LGDKREKHPESILVQNIALVKNCSAEKYLFCFAGSVLFSLLCVYYFCTIFVIQQKKLASVSPFRWGWEVLEGARRGLRVFYEESNGLLNNSNNKAKAEPIRARW
jgi:hypothetical protein